MVILFNTMGAFFGLLGLLVGVALLLATRSLTLGILGVVFFWCWLGRSKLNQETGQKQPAPSIYFVPLFYWGILVSVATLPALFIDLAGAGIIGPQVAADPRAEQFKRDEAGLKSNESDDPDLSAALVSLISQTCPSESAKVRVKSSTDSVLVLMKLPDLNKIPEQERQKLLESVLALIERHRPGVRVFAGIKGRLFYGVISTPGQPVQIGTYVSENLLFGFYQTATPNNERLETMTDEDANFHSLIEFKREPGL